MLARRQMSQLLGSSVAFAATSFSPLSFACQSVSSVRGVSQIKSRALPSASIFREVIGLCFQSKKVIFGDSVITAAQDVPLTLTSVNIPCSNKPEQYILRFKSHSKALSGQGIYQLRADSAELLLYLEPVFTEGNGEYLDAIVNTQLHT